MVRGGAQYWVKGVWSEQETGVCKGSLFGFRGTLPFNFCLFPRCVGPLSQAGSGIPPFEAAGLHVTRRSRFRGDFG